MALLGRVSPGNHRGHRLRDTAAVAACDARAGLLSTHGVRVFTVTYDNSKKKKPGTPFQSYTHTGVIFESGHIAIDSESGLPPCYASMHEMCEKMLWFGKCEVTGLEDMQ